MSRGNRFGKHLLPELTYGTQKLSITAEPLSANSTKCLLACIAHRAVPSG